MGKYWYEDHPDERRRKVLDASGRIVALLDAQIRGVADALPLSSPDARECDVKAFKDSLDGVVCAWLRACALEGRAMTHGDGESAIWVPRI